jgi:glycerate kinase
MKVIIAPDSFKGSLSATNVALAISKGLQKGFSKDIEIRSFPMADGGEGTLEALSSVGGRWESLRQSIAAGGTKEAKILWLSNEHAAVEVAQTVGIEDLSENSPSCLDRDSGPVGEQLRHLLEKGCQKLTVGLGGSCTSDGGIGMLCEIGLSLHNEKGQSMEPKPRGFHRVASVKWNPHPLLEDLEISVMCDVENPLNGANGACAIFGPQKGLEPENIETIDAQIARIHKLIAEKTKRDVAEIPGSGAAGGLGAAFLSLGAQLKPGAEVLLDAFDMEEHMAWADIIITGEGRSDGQTLQGKLPQRLAQISEKKGLPTLLLSGSIDRNAYAELSKTFRAVLSICDGPISLDEALCQAPELLEHTATAVAKLVELQQK